MRQRLINSDSDKVFATVKVPALASGETTFSPDADCTRAQIVTLLNRQFGK